jgi:hypothetical protein
MASETRSVVTAPPGGIWTDEVGVTTGPVELRTECGDDGAVCVSVRYEGADEWYRVRGGTAQLADPADAQVLHEILAAVLHRPQT